MSEPINCSGAPTSVGGQLPGTLSCASPTITLTPTGTLSSGTTYQAGLPAGFPDLAGNMSASHTLTFTTKSDGPTFGLFLSQASASVVAITEPSEVGRFAASCSVASGCYITGVQISVNISGGPFVAQAGVDLDAGNFFWVRFSLKPGQSAWQVDSSNVRTVVAGYVPNGQTVWFFLRTGTFPFGAELTLVGITAKDGQGQPVLVGVAGDQCAPTKTMLCPN